jgi:branched-chain amino acid aminotransferase
VKFWVAGGLVPAEQAMVAVLDHGFTVGDGVFETLKTVNDAAVGVVPFAMDRHIARLSRSAAGMGLAMADPDDVRDALLAVCAANPELADGGRLRVTLTSGPGPLGSDRTSGASTLAVAAAPSSAWPSATTLAISPWPRNERSPLVGLKSTSYAENVLALAHARSHGAGEALMGNLAGEVCEGTGSNVFLVAGGHIVTPPLTGGCLAGITRALVIQWCAEAGMEIVQRATPLGELAHVDEVFITSSTRDVHPIDAVIDEYGQQIWAAGHSPLTLLASDVFATRSETQWNP